MHVLLYLFAYLMANYLVVAQFSTIILEPIKIEPINIETTKTDSIIIKPTKLESIKIEPTKTEPIKISSVQTKPNQFKSITLEPGNFMSIVGPINSNNVGMWIRNISAIEYKNFYVYINSNGGSVDAGQRLIDQFAYLQQQGVTIECIVQNAHSMAFQILQSCDKRYVTPSAKVMQHQMSVNDLEGQFDNLMNYLTMVQQMSNKLDKASAERIGLSYDEYKKKVSTDWWLFGEEIVKANVADEIVYVGCSSELYSSYESKNNIELVISQDGHLDLKKSETKVDLCPL